MSTASTPGFRAAVAAGLLGVVMLAAGCTTAGQPSAGSQIAGSATASAATALTTGKAPGTTSLATTASSLATTASGTASSAAAASTATPPEVPGTSSTSTKTSRGSAPTTALPALPALPSVGLPGVNDPSCTSDAPPVVLLHGTFSSVQADYAAMVPELLAGGRCVYGINYGGGGRGSVRQSAADVSAFVDQVLAATGADQVDVIGYSQGGLVLRTALRLDGLASKVATAVLMAPSFHGSTSPLLTALPAGICPACADQAAGSPLLAELDAGGDLDGGVHYAVVSSADDLVVTPVAAQVPQGPADRVTAIQVQDRCPGKLVDHVSLRANSGVIAWVVAALQTGGSPDPAALTC